MSISIFFPKEISKRKDQVNMRKIAVVYWSGTGNTEQMAQAVAEGVKNAGAEIELFTCDKFDSSMVSSFDAIGFGCPSMGAEALEEAEFEPMFTSCISALSGKSVALFGSYGWGDGEWMRNWEEDCKKAGMSLVAESVICVETPDEKVKKECQALGEALADLK
jgi:flavodoxin I